MCAKWSTDPEAKQSAIGSNFCAACMVRGRCPIGPELKRDLGWNCGGHSIQVIETRRRQSRLRWLVGVFFTGLRVDLRFPVEFYANNHLALQTAFAYARHYVPGAKIESWCDGDYIALAPDGREGIIILIIPRWR
jgi:hypothetical protein